MSSHHNLNPTSGEVMHITHLSDNIGALYLSDEFSDITLIVCGQRFNGHKVILAARSQYFRALLFGGLKESVQDEIELHGTTLPAFKELLKYIYTGHLSLTNQREEIILEIFGLAHQYGFIDLEMAISDYLKEILNIKNACLIFDATHLYNLTKLNKVCFEYMDKHASEIINHESFLQLSAVALNELVSRDSFYAPEIDIFLAMQSWVVANPEVDANQVLKQVRLCLIGITELLNIVRPTGLVSPEIILDAISARIQTRDSALIYRGRLLVDENVAHPRYGAQVLQGEMRSFLLDGDTHNYDMDRGYTRHVITDLQDHGILIKLGTQSIINHIKMLLWDRDSRSYSYYIEVSIDQKDWVKIIDHSDYFCRSWQYLFFQPRVALYIRVVGTNNTVNKVFHIVSFEAYYTNHNEKLSKGFIIPSHNVATMDRSACVIEGVSRSRNALLNGETSNYDWDSGYTCHQLGSGSISVQLGQPYIIDSIRLLLWDCDERSYSYYIEVSGNGWNWDRVVDKTSESCRSWQILRFNPRPVVFIRIVGTRNTANEVFHCVHFECPARLENLGALNISNSTENHNFNEIKLMDQQNKRSLSSSSSSLTPPTVSLPIVAAEASTETTNVEVEDNDSTEDSAMAARQH